MKIDGKRIIAFIIKKMPNEYVIDLADTENKLDNGYKKARVIVSSENIGFISSLFSNDKYAFVGFGNKYNDNIIINYILKNKEILKSVNVSYITNKLEQILDDVLRGEDEFLKKEYKYANEFNSFDLQRFMFSKDQMVSLEQFIKSSDFKYTDEDHDVDNIANILDENKARIDARLKIEEIYNEDLFDAHEGVVGARLMKALYLKKNGLKWSEVKDRHNDVKQVCLGDIIFPNIEFKDANLQDFLNRLKSMTISPFGEWWENVALGKYMVTVNLAGLRMNTIPIKIVSDEDGRIINIDVASFYPSILSAYRIRPRQVNESFNDIYDDMLSHRLDFKKTDSDCSTAMKFMLNGIVGQFMIEGSWLYDPEASLKIRVNGALLMLMLAERLYNVSNIYCITIDGMFIKSKDEDAVLSIVKEWSKLSKLNADITKYNTVYMLNNNDYVADSTTKGFFSYQGNNGRNGTPDIIRIAVTENLLHGIPTNETITKHNDIRDYFSSTSSNDTLEWNGEIFNSARYYYSNDQKLCKLTKPSDFSDDVVRTPITNNGITLATETPDGIPDNINYQYYIAEANRIANKIKVQQLNLFQ